MVELLKNQLADYKLELPETAAPAFRRYYELLAEKSAVMNLTAITGEKETYSLHFADSLALLHYADFKNKSVIDIGSGAGFPGVPIAIAEKSCKLTIVDALQKRIEFLTETCAEIGVDAACIHARAEELAFDKNYREKFDIAASRAVARLNILCELTMPFVRVGGKFLAMKAVDSDEEIKEAENAVKKLGGKIADICDYPVPGTDISHRVIIIHKITQTPTGYPRRFAKIKKSPIV